MSCFASSNLVPPDEVTRRSCSSIGCLIQGLAQSCITSKIDPAFEFWAGFRQESPPRVIPSQEVPRNSRAGRRKISSRSNLLPTCPVSVSPFNNSLAFEFWAGLPPADRQGKLCRDGQPATRRRPQVRLSSIIVLQTCAPWRHNVLTGYQLRPMATPKIAPRLNSGTCFETMHWRDGFNTTTASVLPTSLLASFCGSSLLNGGLLSSISTS